METVKKLWQNRKEKKEWVRRLQSEDPGLEVVHPHAAGIDVGNSAHYVAVRPDRDPQPVCRFGQRYRDQQIQSLKKKAAKLGLQFLPALP